MKKRLVRRSERIRLQKKRCIQDDNKSSSEDSFRKSKRVKSRQNNGTLFKIHDKDIIENWSEWVAATSTKNYILDDGILDVMNNKSGTLIKAYPDYYSEFYKTVDNNKNPNNYISAIMNQGNKFEKKVIGEIHRMIKKSHIIDIQGNINPRSTLKYHETIKAMKKGVPFIYQGIVRNYDMKTYGIPDLLIRSDYINSIFDINPLSKKDVKISAPKLRRRYHYLVVDIKFKTLHLKTDGIHLRNDGVMKAYKSQLCIYNQCLGEMQGYTPDSSYILGWKWKYVVKNVEKSGNNCFSRLGKIDYKNVDQEYVEKTRKAVDWVLDVRKNGASWDLTQVPLPKPELYPNMCNRYDFPYHGLKKKFAQSLKEITLLWNVGVKHRNIAHEKGIYSWIDPKCNTKNMGFKKNVSSKIISTILDANKSTNLSIKPKYIKNNLGDWKTQKTIEFFVDFEMTCSVFTEFDNVSNSGGESLIFLIGVGFMDPNTKEWVFKSFLAENLTSFEEGKICREFNKYHKQIMKKYKCKKIPIYHWSHAEPVAWSKAVNRIGKMRFKFNWVDLLKVFKNEPIGVKGCLNYSLKTIAKIFYENGYISTIWNTGGGCSDGADAAYGAYKIDLECKKNGARFSQNPLTKEIVQYNEVDCKVLQEILYYIRENHVK